jgi:putative tryptophan/tyrosine transport system substrate-binding protein
MRRREFITLLGGAAAWPITGYAQQSDRVRLVGVLEGYAESDSPAQSNIAAFRDMLAKLGDGRQQSAYRTSLERR